MHKLILWLASASLLAVPAKAAQYDGTQVRPGTFVGVRLQLSLGGRSVAEPRAGLAIAPMMSGAAGGRLSQAAIGEGVALNLGPRPTLTFAGIRVDQALGASQSRQTDAQRKLGLSSGGWIAVGVGVMALAGGVYFLHLVDEAEDNSE